MTTSYMRPPTTNSHTNKLNVPCDKPLTQSLPG